VGLDRDVNAYLTSWKVAQNEYTRTEWAATLARISALAAKVPK